MDTKYCSVYTTFPNEDLARKVAREVLEARLAACANIIGPGTSLYWWEGKVAEDKEYTVLFKTKRILFRKLEEKIRALHEYQVPAILSLPIGEGHGPYLAWIEKETTHL